MTSNQPPTCGYYGGSIPVELCGKPAKFTTTAKSIDNGHVCGLHARSVRAWGSQTAPIVVTVERGQIWRSNDPREAPGRPVVVLSTDTRYAYVAGRAGDGSWSGRRSRIALTAFQPGAGRTGYRLTDAADVRELMAS